MIINVLPLQENNLVMKKRLVFIGLLAVLLWGCTKPRKHVYVTYYGTIDIDTMHGIKDKDSNCFYIVNAEKLDSATANAIGLEGAYFVDFYKPSDSSYFRQMFGSDGGESDRIYYNPYNK